jgi:hypothetical protein
MASFDVIVKLVDQTKNSMRSIEGGLKNVEQQAAKTNKALGSVGSALVAIATSAAAAKIVDTAKSFGDLEARIRATSGSGANTAAVMNNLIDTANRLGISIDDAGKAFSILRANGIDASYKSLETWTKLAISSGRSTEDIADAVANAYQGSFGKISKATEDLIQVENKYGSFVIKFRGVVVDTVASSGAAVEAIKKFTEQNSAFADAFDVKSKGTTAALNRLSNALTGNVGFAKLDQSVGGLIDKFTQFLNGTDGVGKAIGYLSKAINFLGDNFETIATIVEVVASIFLVGKLFQGFKAITALVIEAGQSIKSLGFIFTNTGTALTNVVKYIVASWKSLGTSIGNAVGAGAGAVELFVLRVFGSLGTLVKNIGYIMKSFAAPFTAAIAYVVGLFDPLLDKLGAVYEGVKKFIGLGKSSGGVTTSTPTGAGPRTPGQGPQAVAGPGVDVASGVAAAMTGTTNTGVSANTFLEDIIGNLKKAKGEMPGLEKALKSALASGDLSLASKLFEELSSRAEQFGIVVQKDGALVSRDFKLEVDKSAESLRIASQQFKDTETTIRQFGIALDTEALELAKQNLALVDSGLLSKKFANEVQAADNALTENAARLASVSTQQQLFKINLEQSRLAVDTQKQTLGFLSAEFTKGKISLQEYAKELGNLDAALLNSNQVLDQALGAAQREVGITETRTSALEKLNAKFRSGAVDAKNYRVAAGNLGGDTEEIDRAINVYGTFKDKLIENNEFIKKSIKGAATTFSKEFTDAFMQAKSPLEAFKNFFGNILSDIANRMIKQQLADPLAEALTGIANELIGSKGEGKMGKIMTEGMGATGDSMVETIKGAGSKMVDWMSNAAGGITDIFSGMGDSLGSIFSNVFSWIKDGIGNIGSSLGGLSGAGGGSMFGDIFGSIGSFLGFADGGRPPVGQASLVGEKGPELFVPDSGGTVVPNNGTGGSNDPLVVNFNLNAIDTMTGTQFLLQNKPAIVNMIGEAYNKRGRRGPLD